jgi:hypothetical protein
MRFRTTVARWKLTAALSLLLSLFLVLAIVPAQGTQAFPIKMPVVAEVIGGHGSVQPTTQKVRLGHSATINIYPDPGYEISSIIDNRSWKVAQNPYVINRVWIPHMVIVDFTPAEYGIEASVKGGHGKVSPTSQTVRYDDTATIDLIPDDGYRVATITDNGVARPVADPYVIKNVSAYHDVVVTFALDQYTVDASVIGGHGTVDPPTQTVTHGGKATINITPDVGYETASITDNGVSRPVADPYVINDVTTDHNVVVTFGVNEFTVVAAAGGDHGTVSPATQAVYYGGTATINIKPDAGYHCASITDNGVPAPV